MTLNSARTLLLHLAEEPRNEQSRFRYNVFALDIGLAVLSVPHLRANEIKQKISAADAGLRVILASGTVKGLKRKAGRASSRKGLSEPSGA